MNLQRREEISALLAEPVTGGAGQVLEYRDALMECRAHIDTLEQTAAERVIARGAAIKPHTFGGIVNQVRDIAIQYAGTEQLRERIAYALAPHFERDAGPTPDYTGEGSAWVPTVEAWAVVVSRDCSSYASYQDIGGDCMKCDGCGIGEMPHWMPSRSLAGACAIPAGRVLGDGMVAVKRVSVNDALPENGQTVGFVTECANDKWYHGRVLGGRYMAGEFGGFSVPGLMVQASHWFAFPPLPDALRANQGGAAK